MSESPAQKPPEPTGERPLPELLLEDQSRRWQRGERVLVEDYLAEQPALVDDPEAVFDLIYHEIVLRKARGEAMDQEEYVHRFPQWAERLQHHFQVPGAIQAESGEGVATNNPVGEGSAATPDAPTAWPTVPGYD